MSKKHKHDYKHNGAEEYLMEDRGPEQQRLLMLILLLNMLIGRIKEKKIKDSKSLRIKKPLIEVPVIREDLENRIKIVDTYEGESEINDAVIMEPVEGTEDINEGENLNKNEEQMEEDNTDKFQDVAIGVMSHSKVTYCKATTVQYNSSKAIEFNPSFELGVTKIPVILSQFEVQIFMENLLKFPEQIYQVNALEKSIYLDKCQLVLSTNKLFIEGFLKEEIEYATGKITKDNIIRGNIKKSSFKIPFKCSTRVRFNIPPITSKYSSHIELGILSSNTNIIDNREKSYEHFRMLNEKISCKLDKIEVTETDTKEDYEALESDLDKLQCFEKIRKKMIITLEVSLIQEQKVFIKS